MNLVNYFVEYDVLLCVNHLIPWAESVQLCGRSSLSFSSFIFLLKRLQSQSKAFLHEKDAFAFAHIIVQIPLMELNDLQLAIRKEVQESCDNYCY